MAEQLDALAELDARGRRAAESLRREVERTSRPLVVAPAGDPGAAGAPHDDGHVIPLYGPAPGAGQSRRWLVAAAVLVVLAVGVGVFAGSRADDGDSGPVLGTGDRPYLLPDVLPAGMDLAEVTDGSLGGATDDQSVRVYGRNVADPWSGELVLVTDRPADPEEQLYQPEGGETFTIKGQEVAVEDVGVDAMLRLSLRLDGLDVVVFGSGLSAADLAAVADRLEVDEGHAVIPAGGDPDLRLLADRPSSVTFAVTSGLVDGLALSYRGADDTGFALVQASGPEEDVDLLRFLVGDAREVQVRGQRGLVGRIPDPDADNEYRALRWREADGLVVTVVGNGLPEQALLDVAEGLRPAEEGEVDRLVEEHGPDPLGSVPEGEQVIASGDLGDSPQVSYRLSGAVDGELQASLTFATTEGSQTHQATLDPTAVLSVVSQPAPTGPDGTVALIGLAAPEVARVALVQDDGTSIPLDLHPVSGSEHLAFLGFVPADWTGEVVAYDAAADEIGRTVPTLPGGAEPGEPGDSVTECTTDADGGRECSTSAVGTPIEGDGSVGTPIEGDGAAVTTGG